MAKKNSHNFVDNMKFEKQKKSFNDTYDNQLMNTKK